MKKNINKVIRCLCLLTVICFIGVNKVYANTVNSNEKLGNVYHLRSIDDNIITEYDVIL